MKKRVSLLFAMTLLASTALTAANDFTATQTKATQGIVHDYLVAHPDILVTMSQKLQAQQQQAMEAKLMGGVLANKTALLSDPDTDTIKPTKTGVTAAVGPSKVALIEFFDYNCAYCAKAFPIVKAVMAANPNVTYIFKEFPIFASRFTSSQHAAEMGHAIYKQYGAKDYLAFHNGVFGTGKNEGALKDSDVDNVAKKVLALSKKQLRALKKAAKGYRDQVDSTMTLGETLGLRGTPGFIIMPLTGATKANTTVIPGFASQAALQAALEKAAGKTDATAVTGLTHENFASIISII